MSTQPATPKALTGSDEAKRKMAIFLEAIAGIRTIQSASEELGVALVRYYVLETRMLQAMIDALEPRQRGPKRDVDAELQRARDQCKSLEQELMRLKALYRNTQRAVGVKAIKDKPSGRPGAKKTTRKRKPRKVSRGERIAKSVRDEPVTDTVRRDESGTAGQSVTHSIDPKIESSA